MSSVAHDNRWCRPWHPGEPYTDDLYHHAAGRPSGDTTTNDHESDRRSHLTDTNDRPVIAVVDGDDPTVIRADRPGDDGTGPNDRHAGLHGRGTLTDTSHRDTGSLPSVVQIGSRYRPTPTGRWRQRLRCLGRSRQHNPTTPRPARVRLGLLRHADNFVRRLAKHPTVDHMWSSPTTAPPEQRVDQSNTLVIHHPLRHERPAGNHGRYR